MAGRAHGPSSALPPPRRQRDAPPPSRPPPPRPPRRSWSARLAPSDRPMATSTAPRLGAPFASSRRNGRRGATAGAATAPRHRRAGDGARPARRRRRGRARRARPSARTYSSRRAWDSTRPDPSSTPPASKVQHTRLPEPSCPEREPHSDPLASAGPRSVPARRRVRERLRHAARCLLWHAHVAAAREEEERGALLMMWHVGARPALQSAAHAVYFSGIDLPVVSVCVFSTSLSVG